MEKLEESEFFEWLKSKGLSKETLRDYTTAAERLGIEECECDFACIRRKILKVRTKPEKRLLQNYITFCEEFLDELDSNKAKKLRRFLSQKAKEDRKLGVTEVKIDLHSLEEHIRKKLPRVASSVKAYFLMAYFSGIRMKEVLMVKVKLSETQPVAFDGEHGYVELNSKRGYKVATVAFAPLEVFEMLKNAPKVSYNTLKDAGISLKLRENFYQRCVEVSHYPEVCKFMQGRIGDLGVSEIHYLDLLNKAKMTYPLVAKKLRGEGLTEMEMYRLMIKHLERLMGTLRSLHDS